ncbi:exopolyphosphatase [Methylocella sp. CPCC 101449]|jgi:exopolyphosphatase/guanosine-5'-triphosphate,3'-diphosphate pyrophosphatase|uniref:exopolyphosphatase n=1 Tax=Methylocella sp. CPCC 101449 TaxID=2987531 RepID=UPI00288DCC66|nr:exopolyphosphatase [Methylocella sp. CPCC 101449]MDT2021566.1 exopolyphosphatase [Methylocella sp. CPCC 101449]HEV2571658.1 exopolyphosphatase [Beijerinckiaceae bacterium]
MVPPGNKAPGRLEALKPLAVVDIGSNSVRLVAYEGLTRALTPIYNDKVLCGIGRGVATTGKLNEEGVERALSALSRFRVLCDLLKIKDVHVLATAAARDAKNGREFLAAAEKTLGAPVDLLSGERESRLAALGVVSGFYAPDGVVGDLGGGSLELNEVHGGRLGKGVSLPLGGLSLMDMTGRSPKKASKLVRDAIAQIKGLDQLKGRTFYAVGGTWRALARLHMHQRNYPLNVMHGYIIPRRDAEDFVSLVERVNAEALVAIESVAAARRPLLAYGAVVLEEIIRRARPNQIVVSALGLREGLLYERLDAQERKIDPLIQAASDLNILRSRAPRHGWDLCAWTDAFMRSTHIDETKNEQRLRHAACLLADIGWRAHPDYRGEQSFNIIANAAFVSIDHSGRAYLALATSYRHMGFEHDVSPQLRMLATPRLLDRAQLLGAAMRVGYAVSAAMPDVLPKTPLVCRRGKVVLKLPREFAPLASERLANRLRQLGRLIGREPDIIIE